MNEFQFKPEIAELYGVNEAIFIHSLSFWVIKNWSNGMHCHEGRYWSYDTYKDITKRFPFWTVRQIERIVSSCEEQGAILCSHFNEDKTVRTKWYTLAGAAEAIYFTKTVDSISPNGEMDVPQVVDDAGEPGTPISPNGEMQSTKTVPPNTQTVKCNKVTVTNQIDIPPISPKGGRKGKELPQDVKDLLNGYIGIDKELGESMVKFMGVRTKLRAVQDAPSVESVLNTLDKLSGGQRLAKLELLRLSIENSWKTVYAPRGWTIPAPALTERGPSPARMSRVEYIDGEEVVVFG